MTSDTKQRVARGICRLLRFALIALCLLSVCVGDVWAQEAKPPIRLRLMPISIRNRSNGPIPIRMRLEYNQPQIVEGDLELVIYEGKQAGIPEDHIATIRYSGIVIPGQDYERIIVLPPLRMGVQKTWSVLATFTTNEGVQYPLSSSATQINPPMPHELLTTSPLDRGVVVCSCVSRVGVDLGSPNRQYLQQNLSLENYNPLTNSAPGVLLATDSGSVSDQVALIGKQIVYHSQEVAAKDLPADPISYCAYDLILMTDGGLASLKSEQMLGIRKWIAAGGSVCILPDSGLKTIHSEFLNSLVEPDPAVSARYSLSDAGQLIVVDQQPNEPVLARHELGRVVILPEGIDFESWFSMPERKKTLGHIVGFLWKVHAENRVHNGQLWGKIADFSSVMNNLQRFGLSPQEDNSGVYLTRDADIRKAQGYGWITQHSNGRAYVNTDIFGDRSVSQSLAPRNEPLLQTAEVVLLPDDIEMVPIWVFGLILTAYVLTIGPVDYFVLGWLRLRKLTWLLFPVVTLFYTAITVLVAWGYMASDDTGGRLTITDLGMNARPLRQTTIETFYFGASSSVKRDLKNSLMVQGEQIRNELNYFDPASPPPKISLHSPPVYDGNPPQSFQLSQSVEQWSPLSIRALSLEPENVKVPEINWDDASLVTSSEGIARLQVELRRLADPAKGRKVGAAIYHMDTKQVVVSSAEFGTEQRLMRDQFGNSYVQQSSGPNAILDALPVNGHQRQQVDFPYRPNISPGFFQLVSHTSPTGCATLEDLNVLDPTDHRQRMLVVLIAEGENIQVFRKLYLTD